GAKADVLKVRLGGDRAETRIVIDLDKSATGKVASDGQGDRRVVVNLPPIRAASLHILYRDTHIDRSGVDKRLTVPLRRHIAAGGFPFCRQCCNVRPRWTVRALRRRAAARATHPASVSPSSATTRHPIRA
ncbi:MAG TPA: hypothetical protein VM471_09980, partial [Phenylobacterium sp.]|nr:hypothetical protein [Phenylobacterium sp.]